MIACMLSVCRRSERPELLFPVQHTLWTQALELVAGHAVNAEGPLEDLLVASLDDPGTASATQSARLDTLWLPLEEAEQMIPVKRSHTVGVPQIWTTQELLDPIQHARLDTSSFPLLPDPLAIGDLLLDRQRVRRTSCCTQTSSALHVGGLGN